MCVRVVQLCFIFLSRVFLCVCLVGMFTSFRVGGKERKEGTYSSPRRNSAVRERCSRDKLEERTPPSNSVSRMVLRVDRLSVLYYHSPQLEKERKKTPSHVGTRIPEHTLKAYPLSACATPGLDSYLLPALTRKVTAEVGSPLSRAATLTPAVSTTVANVRARRDALRATDDLAANI